MPSYLYIVGFCVIASVVALVTSQFVRRYVWLALLAPTVAAALLQLMFYLHLGYVDAWADVAFVTTWLIAFACTTAVYFLQRLWHRWPKGHHP